MNNTSQSPKVCSVHPCLFFCFAYRVIFTIFQIPYIYVLVYCNGLYLSGLLHSVKWDPVSFISLELIQMNSSIHRNLFQHSGKTIGNKINEMTLSNGSGRPDILRFMGLQRVGHDWETELNWMVLYNFPKTKMWG